MTKIELSKLNEFLPYSLVAKTTSVCPNLGHNLYGVRNISTNINIKQLIKAKYVSFDFEKCCNSDNFIDFTYENKVAKVACARMKTFRKTKSKNTLLI
jgi:hypothetical protein